ncbi:MAG: quinone oxidoreductase family protein [Thermodesulfobacteriota bacterium]
MKAIIYHEFGDVDVLKYEDADVPEISDSEVLVRVKAASINSLDLRLRSGKSPRPVDLPHIGGIDISGDIESTGSGVSNINTGDRVVVNPTVKLEKGFSVIGVNQYGGFAEYVKVPATNVVKIPDNLSYNDASTLPVCYVTAIYGLSSRGGISSGETVLVHAAGSGTGSAAVQIAKHYGAKVIATAGSDEKLEKAKALGADETVNYNSEDFGEVIKGGVDLIFDQVGASFWDNNLKILNPKGRLLLVGVVGGGVVENVGLGPIIMKDLSVLGVTMFNAGGSVLEDAVKLAADGEIKPAIDKTLPLSEASEAQKLLQDRQQFGKVILNP